MTASVIPVSAYDENGAMQYLENCARKYSTVKELEEDSTDILTQLQDNYECESSEAEELYNSLAEKIKEKESKEDNTGDAENGNKTDDVKNDGNNGGKTDEKGNTYFEWVQNDPKKYYETAQNRKEIMLALSAKCDEENEGRILRTKGKSEVAIMYILEGGAVYCGDNQ